MRWLRTGFVRLGELFRRKKRDEELAAEIESHVQMHIEDNLRAGMDPVEARRQALIKFGGMDATVEAYRERRGFSFGGSVAGLAICGAGAEEEPGIHGGGGVDTCAGHRRHYRHVQSGGRSAFPELALSACRGISVRRGACPYY